jgi:hypothetical protein
MNLEREIGNDRTEIEAAEAQLKSMKDRINYSSITLRFYENEERVTGFGADLRDSFKNGWAMLIGLILAIVNLWPIILLVIIGIIFFRKRLGYRITW